MDLWVELEEEDLRTMLLEEFELREGAVSARPLEEADEEELEENLRIILLTPFFFSVELEALFSVLVREGAWGRDEEKRFTSLFVLVLEVSSDLGLFIEEEGILRVSAERLGAVLFTLLVEDLNLEGEIPFPWITELLDVTDF